MKACLRLRRFVRSFHLLRTNFETANPLRRHSGPCRFGCKVLISLRLYRENSVPITRQPFDVRASLWRSTLGIWIRYTRHPATCSSARILVRSIARSGLNYDGTFFISSSVPRERQSENLALFGIGWPENAVLESLP